jgi:hypothetical protein
VLWSSTEGGAGGCEGWDEQALMNLSASGVWCPEVGPSNWDGGDAGAAPLALGALLRGGMRGARALGALGAARGRIGVQEEAGGRVAVGLSSLTLTLLGGGLAGGPPVAVPARAALFGQVRRND